MFEKEITFDRFIRWALIALLIVSVLFALNYLGTVLLPFFVAWLIAYLLYPIVKFVQYRLHVPTRALSIIVTLIFVTAIVAGVVWLIIPPMIEQFSKLGNLMTAYIHKTAHITSIPDTIQQWINENAKEITNIVKSEDFTKGIREAMPHVFRFIGQGATIIISIIGSMITLLYMFFILLDYEYLTENWIRIFPKKVRPFWQELMKDVEKALNNYIRGQGLVALSMGILFCIGFTIIDFPMAIGLGILIGIMDMVPYLPACTHPHRIPGPPEVHRHRSEFLDYPHLGRCRVHHRPGHHRHDYHPENHGQGHGTQPRHTPSQPLRMGSPVRIYRSHRRPAPHHPRHSLLQALCHKGRRRA